MLPLFVKRGRVNVSELGKLKGAIEKPAFESRDCENNVTAILQDRKWPEKAEIEVDNID